MNTTEATKSLLDEIKPLENRCGEIRSKHARILSIPQIDAVKQAVNEYEALNAIAEAAERFIDGMSDGENTIRSTLKALKSLRS